MERKTTLRKLIIPLVFAALLCLSSCSIVKQEAVITPEPTCEIEVTAAPDQDIGKLVISELMGKNRSSHMHADGNFYDWIEVKNISDEVIDLSQWRIAKNGKEYTLNFPRSLESGAYAVAYANSTPPSEGLSVGFSFGYEDTIALITPAGSVSDIAEDFIDEKNISVALNENGEFVRCSYPTPGLENTYLNYDLLCEQSMCSSGLIINEINGDYTSGRQCNTGYEDWIELKNISDQPIYLQDYYLSDDYSDLKKFQLPKYTLRPGNTMIIWCSGDSANSSNSYYHSNFKIDGANEALFLCSSEGIVDYAAYHDVPSGGSMGRLDGRCGWFIFEKSTLNADNERGFRRMLSAPYAKDGQGVYNDVESVTVELCGEGSIYYTTDGSTPTRASTLYSEPITVTHTSIIKAVSISDGICSSPITCLSYIINENHVLPVLSLVSDDPQDFTSAYWHSSVDSRITNKYSGTVSYFDGDDSFSKRCKMNMKGWTSLDLPKKSMGVSFSGADGKLEYDLFEAGADDFSKLSIRAGQDYTFAVIRNELMQELCLEATDNVPTQRSQYCVLYLNGDYWGLYCLKDDVSSSFYSSWVGSDDVVKCKAPAPANSSLSKDVFQYCEYHDMSLNENYDYFCSVFDMDNLIDWIILEGYSANTDIGGNMRYFKTSTGKWQIVFYDLDWALTSDSNAFENVLQDYRPQIYCSAIIKLLKNEEFCDRLCRRGAELLRGPLADENVLAKIDELASIIEPEMQRERDRWSLNVNSWYNHIDKLREFVDNDWAEKCLAKLFKLANAPEGLYSEYNVKQGR